MRCDDRRHNENRHDWPPIRRHRAEGHASAETIGTEWEFKGNIKAAAGQGGLAPATVSPRTFICSTKPANEDWPLVSLTYDLGATERTPEIVTDPFPLLAYSDMERHLLPHEHLLRHREEEMCSAPLRGIYSTSLSHHSLATEKEITRCETTGPNQSEHYKRDIKQRQLRETPGTNTNGDISRS